MKKLTIPFYCTLILFSSYICAMTPDNTANVIRKMTPDNTAAVIRKSAQTVAPHLRSMSKESEPYTLKVDNDDHVIIPAGKPFIMPPDEARDELRNVITHMVNCSGLQQARAIKVVSNVFILE